MRYLLVTGLLLFSFSFLNAQNNEKIKGSWMLKDNDSGKKLLHIEVTGNATNDMYDGTVAGVLGGYDANFLKCPDGSTQETEKIQIFRKLKVNRVDNSTSSGRFMDSDFYLVGKWHDLRSCTTEKCIIWYNEDFTEMKIRNINDSAWDPAAVVTLYRMSPPNKKGVDKVD